jgi:dTDP-4-dehydrorhamnose reductase
MRLLEHPSGTYHVCAGGAGSWADFAGQMALHLSLELEIVGKAMPRAAPLADVGRLSSLMLPLRGIEVPHWDDLLVRYLREARTCIAF